MLSFFVLAVYQYVNFVFNFFLYKSFTYYIVFFPVYAKIGLCCNSTIFYSYSAICCNRFGYIFYSKITLYSNFVGIVFCKIYLGKIGDLARKTFFGIFCRIHIIFISKMLFHRGFLKMKTFDGSFILKCTGCGVKCACYLI